jgi:hypothetical protein
VCAPFDGRQVAAYAACVPYLPSPGFGHYMSMVFMKKLILVALLAVIAWQAYTRYPAKRPTLAAAPEQSAVVDAPPVPHPRVDDAFPAARRLAEPTPATDFKCDGRKYCSQMTSCEEATFFLLNCPGVKMDGDHDGIPCERQWCG